MNRKNQDIVFSKLCFAEKSTYLKSGENAIYTNIILNNLEAKKWLIRERIMSEKHYNQLKEMSIKDIIDTIKDHFSCFILSNRYDGVE